MDKAVALGIPIAFVLGAVVGWVMRGIGVPRVRKLDDDARRSELDTVEEDDGSRKSPGKDE